MREETVKITCDRCGKEIPAWFSKSFRLYTRKITATVGPYSEQKEMDLCEECYKSLRNWYHRKNEIKENNE